METTENPVLDDLLGQISALEAQTQANLEVIVQQEQVINVQKDKISLLEEQIAWFKRQIFGKRSERNVSKCNSEQLTFAGFELPQHPEPKTKEIPSHTRCVPNRNGEDKITLPPDLPVKTVIVDIPEEEKLCPETNEPLVQIGVEISYKLSQQPGSYYIKEIIRPKYAHPSREENGIKIAPLPESLLPRCRADESLLADIAVKKFGEHLPLYRIAESFGYAGIGISRRLLSQWIVRIGLALKPLYLEIKKHVIESLNIFMDETPVLLQEKGKCKEGYMWVIVGGNEVNPPYRVYDFRENRKHENVQGILGEYHGVLHSDKYGAYERLAEQKKITWSPCYAHIRRKFFEAEAGDRVFREWVLRKIRYLFMLEKVAWGRSPEERLRIREKKEIPIIDELIMRIKEKLGEPRILPKSKLGEAIRYFCGLIPYLKNYTRHAYARLDNNIAERAIRPLAIGRKNWLFFGSPEGGEAGAILLSLVQTCRGLGIDPRAYLEDVMRRLMGHSANKLHELLPDLWHKAQQVK